MKENINDFIDYSTNILCRSEDVIIHHKYILLKFERFLKSRGVSSVKDISFSDCRAYIDWYKTTPITT